MTTRLQRFNNLGKTPKGRVVIGSVTIAFALAYLLLAQFKDYPLGPSLGLSIIGLTQLGYGAVLARQQTRTQRDEDS